MVRRAHPTPASWIGIISEVTGALPGDEPWRSEVLRRASILQAALRRGDDAGAVDAAAALAGLGEGSTPAGDDYLVGVLHALRRLRRTESAADLGTVGEGRTTTTSSAWLAAAARGEASPVWLGLLDALDGGDEPAVRAAARSVRRTGHTSGAFSLRGFLDTLTTLGVA